MKILWIVNIRMPELSRLIEQPATPVGGWLSALAGPLSAHDGVDLAIAAPGDFASGIRECHGERIKYFLFPRSGNPQSYCKKQESSIAQIADAFKPDVVHIHGTEYSHSLAALRACGASRCVVSIQGLVSVIERYYYAGLSAKKLILNTTMRDLLRHDTVFGQRRKMRARGKMECMTLEEADHVMGRTDWDRAHVLTINPNLHYYHADEVLRPAFFPAGWSPDRMKRHSIIVPQSNYPIKGLHMALPAFAQLRKKYPELTVKVTGNSFNRKKWFLMPGYGKLLKKMIRELGLADSIEFTGMLDEAAMCRELLSSHVAVNPSAIENSSNALCEAQLAGVPCIASCVGGALSLVTPEQTGLLYRFEEPEALAHCVDRIFASSQLASVLSCQERQAALVRHDPVKNVNNLLAIYQTVMP